MLALVAAVVFAACAPPPTPQAPQPPTAGAAANRIIFWTKCPEVLALTDAQLDSWRDQGVGGFVCKHNSLYALGGSQDFTGDPASTPATATYSLQRQIRDSQIVSRAAARGIKLWFGIGMGNYYNWKTPWAEWYDDAAWTNTVLPNMKNLAAGVKALGFAGLAFDEELYGTQAGPPGDWTWNYPTNTHSEADVRAQVKLRGAQLMQSIVTGFPGAEVLDIGFRLPEGWEELAQQVVNGIGDANAPRVDINFWDGMTSSPGYGQIRFLDSSFNKTPHMPRSNWDIALTYNTNRLYSMFSRRLSNWSYAASRVQVSTFAWIADGGTTFNAARSPQFVAEQLDAFRRWGTGDAFANYASSGLYGFDYAPYVPAMQAAATPGVVDTQPPAITVGANGRLAADAALVSGSATDNMGIRAVRWTTPSGRSGAAKMTWTVTGGDYAVGYQWRMDWLVVATGALPGETITITTEDVRGLTTSTTAVARSGANPPARHRVNLRRCSEPQVRARFGSPPMRRIHRPRSFCRFSSTMRRTYADANSGGTVGVAASSQSSGSPARRT